MSGPDAVEARPWPMLSSAPVLRPTREEMDNLDTFLEKSARPVAERFGGVLIEPPASWSQPKLGLGEDTQFYTRKQRLPAIPTPEAEGRHLLTESLVFPYSERLVSVKNFRENASRADAMLFGKLFETGGQNLGSDQDMGESAGAEAAVKKVGSLEESATGEPGRRLRKMSAHFTPVPTRKSGQAHNLPQSDHAASSKVTTAASSGTGGERAGRSSDGNARAGTQRALMEPQTIEEFEKAFWEAMENGIGGQEVDVCCGVCIEAEGAYDANSAKYVCGACASTGSIRAGAEANAEPASSFSKHLLKGGRDATSSRSEDEDCEDDQAQQPEGAAPDGCVPSEGERSACRVAKENSEPRWNLGNIAQSSLLRYLPPTPGINRPMFYVGHLFTRFCWHVEDCYLNSISYLHRGSAEKIWYVVPPGDADAFEKYAAEHVFSEALQVHGNNGRTLLGEKTTLFDPRHAAACGVPVHRIVHRPGTFVYTAPRAYHAGFNTGYNVAEAVNYASVPWFPLGRLAAEHMRKASVQASVPVEYLLYCKAWEIVGRHKALAHEPRGAARKISKTAVEARDASIVASEMQKIVTAGEAAVTALARSAPCRILQEVRFAAPLPVSARQNEQPSTRPATTSSRSSVPAETPLSAILNDESRSATDGTNLSVVRHCAELDATFGDSAGMRCTVCQHLSHFFIAVCDTCPDGGDEARCPHHFLLNTSNVCGKDGHRPVVLRRHSPVELWDVIGALEDIAGIEVDPLDVLKRFTQYVRPWQVCVPTWGGDRGCFLAPTRSRGENAENVFLQRHVGLSIRGGLDVREKSWESPGKKNDAAEGGYCAEQAASSELDPSAGLLNHGQDVVGKGKSQDRKTERETVSKAGVPKRTSSRLEMIGAKGARGAPPVLADERPGSGRHHPSIDRQICGTVNSTHEIESGGGETDRGKRRRSEVARKPKPSGSGDVEDSVRDESNVRFKDGFKSRGKKSGPKMGTGSPSEGIPQATETAFRDDIVKERRANAAAMEKVVASAAGSRASEAEIEYRIPTKTVRTVADASEVEARIKRRKTSDGGLFKVSRLCRCRWAQEGHRIEVLCEWKDFSVEEATWEPTEVMAEDIPQMFAKFVDDMRGSQFYEILRKLLPE